MIHSSNSSARLRRSCEKNGWYRGSGGFTQSYRKRFQNRDGGINPPLRFFTATDARVPQRRFLRRLDHLRESCRRRVEIGDRQPAHSTSRQETASVVRLKNLYISEA